MSIGNTTQMAPENSRRVAASRPVAAGTAAPTWEDGEAAARPATTPARILVVDDDPMILTLIERVLQSENFVVSKAEDGHRAVDLFHRDGGVSVVILDWRMPGISGEQVFDKLVAIRPDVKVIVASGESPADVQCAFSGRKVLDFLPKPFKIQSLVAAVKSALAA
jgi:DNA-binding NtrC family response regulator